MKKNLIRVTIILSMLLLTLIPLSVNSATSGTCGDKLTWVLDSNGTLTISGTGAMTDWDWGRQTPWSNNGSNNSKIIEVIIEDGVTTIGNCAFEELKNLKSVDFGRNITSIGKYAFNYCEKLSYLAFTDNIKTIGKQAFGWCNSLTSVDFTTKVETIEDYAFACCRNLKYVGIPSNVKYIGDGAFYRCENLVCFEVDDDNANYSSEKLWHSIGLGGRWGGSLFNKDKTKLIQYAGLDNSYIIPDSVITVGYGAFYDCNSGNPQTCLCSTLTSITFPASVKSIESMAFYSAYNLKDVYYGGSKEQWNKIKIDSGNTNLTNATIHYILPSTKTTFKDNQFIVTPKNVPNGSNIIFACYNGNKMVYVNPYIYAGETTIPFSTTETYDKVKVMVWENLETCVPLCEAENVPLN